MCNLINIHTYIHTYIHAQGTLSLSKNCTSRESVSPLSRLIRGFRIKYSLIPPREDQCEWHRMTRMTGPDCVVRCNLINTYIHTYIRTYIHVASDQRFS